MPYGNGQWSYQQRQFKRDRISYNLYGVPSYSTVTETGTVYASRCTGVYRPKPASDPLPVTSYLFESDSYKYTSGTHILKTSNGSGGLRTVRVDTGPKISGNSNCFNTVANLSLRFGSNTRNRLLLDIHKRRSQVSMNLGVTLAESKETLGFLSQSIGNLGRFGRNMYRGRWSAAFRSLGITEDPYELATNAARYDLAYKFGVRPIVSDVFDAIQTIDTGITSGSPHWYARSFIQHKIDEQISYGDHKSRRKGIVRRSVACCFRLDSNRWRTGQQLGLTNPFQVAHEVIPFSFVLDWFVPVGDWLSQFDLADQMTSFVNGTDSLYGKFTDYGITGVSPGGFETFSYPGDRHEKVYYERTPITSTYVSFPPLPDSFKLSSSKALTSLELLLSLRGR